jgi:spore coat protein H
MFTGKYEFFKKKNRLKKAKSLLLLIVFCPSFFLTRANDTITVKEYLYQTDHAQKLIVVNQNTEQINAQWTQPKTAVILDELYSFRNSVSTIEIGVPYEVANSDETNYTLYFTQLPLVNIFTPHAIVDEPRVFADFTMSESNGNITRSNIGIEYRGGWSQTLPKKSLRIEFWNDTSGQVTKDVSLLGMRNDDDWNLQAFYNEPLRIRSKTSNELWKILHTLYYQEQEPDAVNGIQMEYVEVFVNGQYRGVYALSERVDRKQLQLKKYDYETRGELYKAVNWGVPTLRSLPDFNNSEPYWDGFEYKYPEEETDWINLYGFVDFVVNENNYYFFSDYPTIFEINNAVDYFIFLNLLRANDNRGKNIFIARYDQGEPYFYVPWDLDGVFGTMWRGKKENRTNDILSNGLYDRIICDCSENGFCKRLTTRWNNLRRDEITHQNIMNLFRENFNYLSENGIYEREARAWGEYTLDETHLEYISEWLSARLSFLDEEFNKPCVPHNKSGEKDEFFIVFPNPANDYLHVEIKAGILPFRLKIFNQLGHTVFSEQLRSKSETLQLPNLQSGMYLVRVQNQNLSRTQKLVIRK